MVSNSKYKVIVSDRAKRMLGTHIRFMAQVKEAAAAKKKEIMANCISRRINITRCSLKSGILSFTKSKMIRSM